MLNEDADEGRIEDLRIVVHGRGKEINDEETEVRKWNKLISDYKRYVIVLVYESF